MSVDHDRIHFEKQCHEKAGYEKRVLDAIRTSKPQLKMVQSIVNARLKIQDLGTDPSLIRKPIRRLK